MEEFRKKYKEEAFDLINDLEKAILTLEESPNDKSIVEQIFRIMHSLKGGGAMFGFDKVSEFTHHLESVYDLVRTNQIRVSPDLLSVTFNSVDHLKMLLSDDVLTPDILKDGEDIALKVIEIMKIDSEKEKAQNNSAAIEIKNDTNKTVCTYYIYFAPAEDIFDNGTNPLFLIDELAGLGETLVFLRTNKLPVFELYAPSRCYFAWEIIISTAEVINSLKDVFIFVEDECTLEVVQVADRNLLADAAYVLELKAHSETEMKFSHDFFTPQSQKKEKKAAIQDIQSRFVEIQNQTQNQTTTVPKKVQRENLISSIRVSSDKLDKLMNLVSELVTTQASLTLFADENQIPGLVAISENVENISRQLRDIAFSISLVPLETLLTRFQRLVRDLSSGLNKEIEFVTEGIETELDKNLIQVLSEPLMHIIRNSIDHGIEERETRVALGKNIHGKILLKAFYSGANVVIMVQDDGKGIDSKIIRQKAIDKGFINAETHYTEKDILNMVFFPGLSTAQAVSEISGRGVGMDVVKRKITEVRGEVDIETTLGVGTTFTIRLPLTLSIIDGLLVKIDDTFFIIPLSVVDKIYPVERTKIENSFNNILTFEKEQIPFHDLSTEFNLTKNKQPIAEVVVVSYEEGKVGLAVDVVIGEYQAVLKPLGKMYRKQEMISGASILGDGTVALVMDTNKIIKILSNEI